MLLRRYKLIHISIKNLLLQSDRRYFYLILVETTFLTVPASQLCGHDPCQVSVCLKMPMTKCLTSALCKPVYFDETGNVFNCTGKMGKFSSYSKVWVVDGNSETVPEIRHFWPAGVLKTPVGMSCSRDPCIGKLCPIDPQAKCFTDYHCKSTFWNLDVKEEIAECKGIDSLHLHLVVFIGSTFMTNFSASPPSPPLPVFGLFHISQGGL